MARKKKQQVGSDSNSSSFTNDLFGPKDPPPSTVFGSVFGPPSSTRKHDFGDHYGNAKQGIPGNNSHRGKEENSGPSIKDKNNKYNSQTVEPSYLGSSIYYGAQESYSPPTSQTNASQSAFKRDGKDGSNLNGADNASRGDWWQGSLYY